MAIEDEDIDSLGGFPDFLRDPIGIPRRHWLSMTIALALGLIGAGVAVATWQPVYKATATLLVARQVIPEDFVRSTVEEDPFNQLTRMLGEVLSRAKLSAIIEEYGLYPELRATKSMNALIGVMRSGISLEPTTPMTPAQRRILPTTMVYRLQFEYGNPDTAADVTNALAGLVLEAGLKGRMEQAGQISKFLQQELIEAEQELELTDAKIAAFKQQYRGELPDELGANLGRLQRMQDQRQSLATQISETETRIATMAATSADAGSPRARLNALQATLETELAVHTPEHPNVVALQRQVDALERQISQAGVAAAGDSIEAVIAASRLSLARQREELARVEAEIIELDARVERTPKRQEELDSLQRVADVKRNRYMDMMHKVEEAGLAEQLETSNQGANISVIDRAHPPSAPERTRLLVGVIGVVGAFMLAAGIGLFFELLDPAMVDRDQTERLTDVPVLGSIPRIS